MTIEIVIMTLNRIPEIKAVVDSGTDWKILGGFVLTAIAVAAGSFVTIWTFRKTVRSQEELARKVSVKQSRQDWINELRTSCSEYVSAVMILQDHQSIHAAHSDMVLKLLDLDPSTATNMQVEWGNTKRTLRSSAYSLRAKIILLSNPKEQLFQELLVEIDEVLDKAELNDDSVIARCNRIIGLTQKILKIEWDRSRKMAD